MRYVNQVTEESLLCLVESKGVKCPSLDSNYYLLTFISNSSESIVQVYSPVKNNTYKEYLQTKGIYFHK